MIVRGVAEGRAAMRDSFDAMSRRNRTPSAIAREAAAFRDGIKDSTLDVQIPRGSEEVRQLMLQIAEGLFDRQRRSGSDPGNDPTWTFIPEWI
jgi:hypothetical protein